MVNEKEVLDYLVNKVETLMEDRGIKTWYMAYYSDMGEYYFRKFLKRKFLPNTWNLILIAELLDCTVNDLLGYSSYNKRLKTPASGICMAQRHIISDLGVEIMNRINELGISTSELAYRVGVSEYSIRSWITCRYDSFSKTSTIMLLRICDALECTPSDLLGY